MAEPALAAAYRAVKARLSGGGEPWDGRVYGDVIPPGATWPAVSFFWSGGGEANRRRTQDAELVLTVKAISESQAEAFTAAERISVLLNDNGQTEVTSGYLNGGDDWYILTCTQEDAVHLVEMFAGAAPIYHEGARYRLIMEVK